MTMEDVDMGMGDNMDTQPLSQTFGYAKAPVPFTGMSSLVDCPYMGGATSTVAQKL